MIKIINKGYYIAIGGEGKMFTLRQTAAYSNHDVHIQNLGHTVEVAEQRAFEVTGFKLEAPALNLNALASQVTLEDATLPYGKYRGELVVNIVEEDLGYLVWWANRAKEFYANDLNSKPSRLDRIIMEHPAVVEEIERREAAYKARQAKWKAEKEALQNSSKHIGEIGVRQEFVGTVTFTKSFENDWGIGFMTKLVTDDGNEVMYWNIIGADASEFNFDGKIDADKGDRVSFFAKIKDHGEYDGVKQTTVQRATKGKLLEAGESTKNYLSRYYPIED